MKQGDILRLETPGGGGYGDPLHRPPKQVLRDVEHGYYDRETARKGYGVVIERDRWLVDTEATARLRASLSGAQTGHLEQETD